MDDIKKSFLQYLRALDYGYIKKNQQTLLDDLDMAISYNTEICNTPQHNILLLWGEHVLSRVI